MLDNIICTELGMLIFIREMSGKAFTLRVEPSDSIQTIKQKVEDKEGTLVKYQRMIWAGKGLEDQLTLDHYNIPPESMIHLVLRLPGAW